MSGGRRLNLRRAKERRIGKLRAQAAKRNRAEMQHHLEMRRLAARPGGIIWHPGPPPPPLGGNRFSGP